MKRLIVIVLGIVALAAAVRLACSSGGGGHSTSSEGASGNAEVAEPRAERLDPTPARVFDDVSRTPAVSTGAGEDVEPHAPAPCALGGRTVIRGGTPLPEIELEAYELRGDEESNSTESHRDLRIGATVSDADGSFRIESLIARSKGSRIALTQTTFPGLSPATTTFPPCADHVEVSFDWSALRIFVVRESGEPAAGAIVDVTATVEPGQVGQSLAVHRTSTQGEVTVYCDSAAIVDLRARDLAAGTASEMQTVRLTASEVFRSVELRLVQGSVPGSGSLNVRVASLGDAQTVADFAVSVSATGLKRKGETSEGSGEVRIPNLAPGSYQVRLAPRAGTPLESYDAGSTTTRTVTIESGRTTDVVLETVIRSTVLLRLDRDPGDALEARLLTNGDDTGRRVDVVRFQREGGYESSSRIVRRGAYYLSLPREFRGRLALSSAQTGVEVWSIPLEAESRVEPQEHRIAF